MFERFSEAARNTVTEGVKEAALRGDRRVGTDHLLLGILHDPASAAIVGVDLAAARRAEETLDREALAAVGVDPGPEPLVSPRSRPGRLPLTSGAKAVLTRTVRLAAAERSRTITSRHVLLALAEAPAADPAAALLARLGVDRAGLRTRLYPA
ncbi:Clp protease N-terminal domain-containing protein [Sinomonas sp. JGH33]|uniref:Clp protease N-terminal domain-containing protein n=1 Tax=Sinomonas terricola TaxID=3110330 RepID=A0ABU5TAF1_9MICC|nr:Clp protease N-terminal domain-containing protein [Sinomonas sp. JGH33]MEA5456643.1 Clp protease N-terminal domain-containing protein [Sinomonas sp. JGH33]